jgi:hypothetical protein
MAAGPKTSAATNIRLENNAGGFMSERIAGQPARIKAFDIWKIEWATYKQNQPRVTRLILVWRKFRSFRSCCTPKQFS